MLRLRRKEYTAVSSWKFRSQAFSLIELLIATAILSIGLIVVLRAISFSARATGISLDMSKAVFLADDKMQELEFKKKGKLNVKEIEEDQGKEGKFNYKYIIKPEQDLNLSAVEFEVSWKRANDSRSITVNTYLR